ncbi:MAG: YlxR family protein [Acidimicrobiales bacterium]
MLVRVAARPDGTLAVGRALHGRGAWLCAGSATCLEQAVRHRGLSRGLRRDLAGEAVASLVQSMGSGTQWTKVCEDRAVGGVPVV